MAVDIVVIISLEDGMRQRFADLLVPLVEETRREPGCELFEGHFCNEQAQQVVLIERWRDRGAIETHMTQPYTAAFIAATHDLIVNTEVRTLTAIESSGNA